jgi:AraC-like DNA-binding protein
MERILYRSGLLTVGEFRCGPEEPRWHEVNVIAGGAHAVFPLTSSVIQHVGRDPVLGNPNHVIFYADGQPYRRRLHDERGDRSIFVAFRGSVDFPCPHGPSDPAAYLAQRAVVRHLLSESHPDAIAVEETLTRVVDRAVRAALARHGIRRRERETTSQARHALVEAAKAVLTERMAERLTLSDVAHAVHASEFHLARVFRAQTGFTLHEYRNQLRLRRALELVEDGRGLVCVACEVGYASHSHLTDSFRRAFGLAPSEARTLGPRGLRELSRKLAA